MSVVSYGREPGYPKTVEAFNGKKAVLTHTDRWTVITNSDSDVGGAILSQIPFPIGSYFSDGLARLKTRRLDRDREARLKWVLDMEYTSEFDDQSADDSQLPPDQRRPKWSWSADTMETLLRKDADTGKAVANSVGEPIEYTTNLAIPVLTISRHEFQFSPDTILNYMNHRNEAEFWGAPAGTALMARITDDEDSQEVFAGVAYRRVTYVIKFKLPFIADVMEGWTALLMDRGSFYIDPATDKKKVFTDANGSRTTGLLDGTNGFRLGSGFDPIFLSFSEFPEADFAALNLGPF